MYQLKVKTHFDAAHKLEGYPGACRNLHGHTWYVEVELLGEQLNELNMLLDFKEVKLAVEECLEVKFDHRYLNETLEEARPTAEFLAKYFFDALTDYMTIDVTLVAVTVWESPDCSVRYSPDD